MTDLSSDKGPLPGPLRQKNFHRSSINRQEILVRPATGGTILIRLKRAEGLLHIVYVT